MIIVFGIIDSIQLDCQYLYNFRRVSPSRCMAIPWSIQQSVAVPTNEVVVVGRRHHSPGLISQRAIKAAAACCHQPAETTSAAAAGNQTERKN